MSYQIVSCFANSGPPRSGGARYSKNNGANWNTSTFNAYFSGRSTVSSSNGQIIVVSGMLYVSPYTQVIYTSTDSGVTFSPANTDNLGIFYLASSSDCSFLTATNNSGIIQKSTDYGTTWTNLYDTGFTNRLVGITMSKIASGSGYTIAAVDLDTNTATGNIYISTDSGASWNTVSSFPGSKSKAFQDIVCSADGTKMYACSTQSVQDPPSNDGAIYYSTDSGATWNLFDNGNFGKYSKITCSDDGSKIFCTMFYSGIWYSSNSGTSWNLYSSPSGSWYDICCSGDGTFIAAINNSGSPGYIYTSNNSGVGWTEQAQSGYNTWTSIAITAAPVCVLGTTEILMADNSIKMIKDIQRGDFVMTDKKTGAHKKVCRVVNSLYDGNVVRIPKGLLGNYKPIILTGGHPIWVNKDQNRVRCRDIVKRQWVHLCELFYNIQFEDEGTYYANGVKMDSLSPNNHERKLPKELYFDSSKYDEALIIKTEDDPRRLKPKMIDRYVSMKTKSL
jgi:hypothetical protein